MKKLIYIFIILFCSCSYRQQHQDILKNIDEINVQYLPIDTTFKSYKDSISISICKEIIAVAAGVPPDTFPKQNKRAVAMMQPPACAF